LKFAIIRFKRKRKTNFCLSIDLFDVQLQKQSYHSIAPPPVKRETGNKKAKQKTCIQTD
jgi:hypothetical protein